MANDARRVTILDVARHAGVSQGSVSRVLTGKDWVSDKLRRKVEAAVQELGYVPNSLAQGLKSQRSRAIAALVSDISNPLHGQFLGAAEEVLHEAGYMLFVSSTHSRPQRELELLDAYRSGRVDGLIVAMADEGDQKVFKALGSSQVPLVFHDRENNGLGDAVVVDHRSGAYLATQHLLKLGHKRIAVFTPSSTIRPGRERLAGYAQALREAGAPEDARLVCELDASSGLAFSETKALLDGEQRPTALICLGTGMLAGVLTAIASAGLRIPQDISIIGIGDTDLVRLHSPALTSLRWDIASCGRLAAHMLLERLDKKGGRSAPPKITYVPVELVVRDSCAAPVL